MLFDLKKTTKVYTEENKIMMMVVRMMMMIKIMKTGGKVDTIVKVISLKHK